MEISQYTYFQQVGGLDCNPVSLELTYGLERLAMYVLDVDNVYDPPYNDDGYKYRKSSCATNNKCRLILNSFDTDQKFQQFIFAEKSWFLLDKNWHFLLMSNVWKPRTLLTCWFPGVISVLERQGGYVPASAPWQKALKSGPAQYCCLIFWSLQIK